MTSLELQLLQQLEQRGPQTQLVLNERDSLLFDELALAGYVETRFGGSPAKESATRTHVFLGLTMKGRLAANSRPSQG